MDRQERQGGDLLERIAPVLYAEWVNDLLVGASDPAVVRPTLLVASTRTRWAPPGRAKLT